MTADGHFEVPRPTNEPVRQYPPGDPHRKSLKGRLAELTDARTEIPMTIGGEHRAGNGKGDLRAPHRKELSIGRYAVGVVKDFDDAINSALKARRTWAATAYHERAAVMLRAASLLAGPWRDTINAATMLGQSKTVHQAEIDSACESIDFWRFNAYFGDQLLRQQPYNDATAWNRFEYRPLEGFVFAVSPFNFTSIAANLPTAPVLMGNTVVFEPATQTLLVSHFLMELFAEAGLPPGVINMVSGSASEISEKVLNQRAYVPQAMWKHMRSDMADLVEAIPQGDVADFRNFMGAVIDGKAYAKHMAAIDYAKKSDAAKVVAGGTGDDSVGWFVRPTVIETTDPDFKLLKEELFGPILTVYPYPDGKFEETLELCDRTSPYGLTGAVFARDRAAIRTASETLINAAGNFYINDKPTGAVVGQQPFGGARASGTNDKAGSFLNLIRWTSPRVIKETYGPPTDHRYPFMDAEPADRP